MIKLKFSHQARRPQSNLFCFSSIFFSLGTRIVYERAFLMNLKNSPLARTPPSNLNNLPHNILRNGTTGVTSKPKPQQQPHNSPPKFDEHQEQFDMDL